MEPEQKTETTLEKRSSEQLENLHKVTPLSKYLTVFLFMVLPFLGGWIGYLYAPVKVVEVKVAQKEAVAEKSTPQTTSSEKKQVGNATTTGSVAFLLQRLSGNYAQYYEEFEESVSIFTPVYQTTFEWYQLEPGMNEPVLREVQGMAMRVPDISFRDSDPEYGSYVYKLDAEILEWFELQESFKQSTLNASDHPTSRSSRIGLTHDSAGMVCLREIIDTESEFLVYEISCGLLVDGLQSLQASPSTWSVYRNEEYDFQFEYPDAWEFSDDYEYTIPIFTISASSTTIIVLPNGEFDYGPPQDYEKDLIKVAGSVATSTIFYSGSDSTESNLRWIQLSEEVIPDSWNRYNRIEIRGPTSATTSRIINSLSFF